LTIPIQLAGRASLPTKSQKPENPIKHTVQKGETLTSIARKYDLSVGEIKSNNHLNGNVLKMGQVLNIFKRGGDAGPVAEKGAMQSKNPGSSMTPVSARASTKTYIVQKGDSLSQIAAQNNLSLKKLLELNHITHNEQIRPGQTIVLQQ